MSDGTWKDLVKENKRISYFVILTVLALIVFAVLNGREVDLKMFKIGSEPQQKTRMSPSDSTPSHSSMPEKEQVISANRKEKNVVHHQGQVEISVVDLSGVQKPLQEVYVSCAKEQTNIKMQGETKITVAINNCQQLSVNASLLGSERWLSDAWHYKNKGQSLSLNGYNIVVNGIPLNEQFVQRQGEYANYQVKLLMQ